jgi:HK97 family phage prohead protease
MKKAIVGDERRYFQTGIAIETREAGTKGRNVVGYALKFNTLSRDLGGFMEQISPKALEGVDLSDVVCLFNHDKNFILARTSSNTLKLTVDETGLKYEFEAPETTAGNDLLISIGRGDVAGSSFAFRTGDDNWERVGDNIIRTILKFEKVVDVSPVVFPAYTEADVAKRSLEEWQKEITPPAFKHIEITKTLIELNRK